MDKYLAQRFSYLNDLSVEELKKLREEVINELTFYSSTLQNANESSLKKSEFQNIDIQYERDKYKYVDYLIQEKNDKKDKKY